MSLPPVTGPEFDSDSDSNDPLAPETLPPVPRRIPNIGHALLFVSFTGLLLLLVFGVIVALMGKLRLVPHGGAATLQHPILQIALQAAIYLITLLVAWLFFPLIWHRTFLDGIQWHWSAVRGQANRLITLGFALFAISAVVDKFVTTANPPPIDQFFLTPATAWLITLFGTFAAPVFEEICFRGFLLPAFAIAYDWIALPRTEEGRTRWQTTTGLTPASLIFSAVLTSFFFALLHAQQLEHLWVPMVVMFSISLVLTFVRIKTQSVAASALVHAAYNGFLFLITIIATGGYRHLDRLTH
jgi:membrane protease YdiL (CAAX protease family)